MKGVKRGRAYVVDEPDQADDKEAEAVEAEDEEVRGFGVLHRVFLELLGLLNEESHDKENGGEGCADAEAGAPYCAQVPVVAGCCDDVRYKGPEDEPLLCM
jgi:hypothetical protein